MLVTENLVCILNLLEILLCLLEIALILVCVCKMSKNKEQKRVRASPFKFLFHFTKYDAGFEVLETVCRIPGSYNNKQYALALHIDDS